MDRPHRPFLPPYLGLAGIVLLLVVAGATYLCVPSDLTLSRCLYHDGQVDEALSYTREAISRTEDVSTRAKLRWRLSQLELKQGRPEESLRQLRKAIEEKPGCIRFLVRLFYHYELFCQPKEAMAALEEAVRAFRTWRDLGRPGLADQADGVVALSPTEIPTEDILKARFEEWFQPYRRRLGWYERWYQKLPNALTTYRELAAEYPDDAGLWEILSRLEAYAGNRDKSESALLRLVRLNPRNSAVRRTLALRYQWGRQPEKSMEISPPGSTLDETRRQTLQAFAEAGRGREGITEYVKRYPNDRDIPALRMILVESLIYLGDVKEARKVLEETVREYPQRDDASEKLGDLLLGVSDYAAAVPILVALSDRHPENQKYARMALAALDGTGAYAVAVARVEAMFRRDPKNESLARELGLRYVQLERFSLAEPLLKRAQERDPKDEAVLYAVARLKGATGHEDDSLVMVRKLIESETSSVTSTARSPVSSCTGPVVGGVVRRRVLALYKRSESESSDNNWTNSTLETVLNHLGLVVDHRAVEEPLLADEAMAPYCGVITWFHSLQMVDAERFVRWLTRQPHLNRPVVVMDSLGWVEDAKTHQSVPSGVLDDLYRTLGIKVKGEWVDDPARIEVVHCEPEMCAFERPLAYEIDYLMGVQSIDPRNHVYLKLKHKDKKDLVSDAVFVGPNAAFCLDTYSIRFDPERSRYQWRLNPFEFFRKALRLDGMPRVDFTTRDGSRLAYFQVDGDGSEISCFWNPLLTCAGAFYSHVLEKRRLPMTVSFIAAFFDPSLHVDRRALDIATKTFAHHAVECAHHSYSHPMDWQGTESEVRVPGYGRFNLHQEIVGAKKILDRICPLGKSVNVLLWPGRANWGREALRIAEEAGLVTFNGGGDSRMDPNYPSVAHLSPPHRIVDGLTMYLNSTASEYTFSERGALPQIAYVNVLHTFQSTESPRRLSPVNVYLNFCSVVSVEARAALDAVLDWVEGQPLLPITVSDYVKTTTGFRRAKIEQLAPETWRVSNQGECRTVRFDSEGRFVDLPASKGVRGFNRHNGALYVHLDTDEPATIRLSTRPPTSPYLVMSTAQVRALKLSTPVIEFEARSLGRGLFRFGGLSPSSAVTIESRPDSGSGPIDRIVTQTDIAGFMTFHLNLGGTRRVSVIHGGSQDKR